MTVITTYEDTFQPCTACDEGTYHVYSNDGVTRCRYCGHAPQTEVKKATVRGTK